MQVDYEFIKYTYRYHNMRYCTVSCSHKKEKTIIDICFVADNRALCDRTFGISVYSITNNSRKRKKMNTYLANKVITALILSLIIIEALSAILYKTTGHQLMLGFMIVFGLAAIGTSVVFILYISFHKAAEESEGK